MHKAQTLDNLEMATQLQTTVIDPNQKEEVHSEKRRVHKSNRQFGSNRATLEIKNSRH
jgi:hypothetical protein